MNGVKKRPVFCQTDIISDVTGLRESRSVPVHCLNTGYLTFVFTTDVEGPSPSNSSPRHGKIKERERMNVLIPHLWDPLESLSSVSSRRPTFVGPRDRDVRGIDGPYMTG